MATPTVDPITLSVVRGVLETTQREMTLALEKTARSSVFNLAHDYSTALFNHTPEMILQGQDIPIHLGSLIPAMKAVAGFFEGDINEGDLILHNDPDYAGSHIIDTCMYYPVFYQGELVFWTVCKGHLTDIGGPVPAGYNPEAKEIFAEGLRIPPVKIWDKGKPRHDVLNMLLTNMRARRDQEGDFNALIGACQVGARNLVALMDKYGKDTVQDCIEVLLSMANKHMDKLISQVPDGTYTGTAVLEDAGHGFGDFDITATVTIKGETCHIEIASPPQIPYFINSYEGNSYSGVYLGLMMFAQLPPPYNEGLYRNVTVNMGPKGTLCNAKSPAPHMNCTTTPMETLTDAVRLAFEQAAPDKVSASWGHANGCNIAGWDDRHDEEYVTMVLASVISGAGATATQDGWHVRGPLCCFGALTSGDIEMLEHSYPIIIHRYSMIEDSGGAGKFRGGSGACWEVEPLDKPMTLVTFGEGRRIPAMGAAGAESKLIEKKVGRLEITRNGKTEVITDNVIETINPGERAANINPGGGGFGPAFERSPAHVVEDVRNGLVSIEAARIEYGVVFADAESLQIDEAETARLRASA
ncbi:MAG: caprolactamase subunit beta [Cognatishimia activa]|jgi:N-methylhydantoinase B|uniref:caprolactamase subunit beta n=3 Tax=Rhodobacterales TaxID=204455 RepID=UPI0007C3C593|nr:MULTISPECIES: hydantoinase B/oxoprolinase family protein [unclassified Sulfitobacter]KZY05030.1 hydantoinase [Sulfitobacter sp. HI0023]KZY27211.1 hydantoinase [Sulfitobacter sp. HI0040]KZY49141.1 hydantoinase [Sulfitobacter sp. HI0054]MEC9312903.1 hydantoinase B/oxoprolinase family protein [Pseudomonadota bacterium]